MAVADLAAHTAGQARIVHITRHAAVIGGGIAGMTAALAISDGGHPGSRWSSAIRVWVGRPCVGRTIKRSPIWPPGELLRSALDRMCKC